MCLFRNIYTYIKIICLLLNISINNLDNIFVICDFRGTCSLFICRNVEGVHVRVLECLRGTWETKGWEPLL